MLLRGARAVIYGGGGAIGPARRAGRGHVAAFAASHYARSMTGTALNITGGSVVD